MPRWLTGLLVGIREGRAPEVSGGVKRPRSARSSEQLVTDTAAAGHWV